MYEPTTLGYPYLAGELDGKSLPRRRTVGEGATGLVAGVG